MTAGGMRRGGGAGYRVPTRRAVFLSGRRRKRKRKRASTQRGRPPYRRTASVQLILKTQASFVRRSYAAQEHPSTRNRNGSNGRGLRYICSTLSHRAAVARTWRIPRNDTHKTTRRIYQRRELRCRDASGHTLLASTANDERVMS